MSILFKVDFRPVVVSLETSCKEKLSKVINAHEGGSCWEVAEVVLKPFITELRWIFVTKHGDSSMCGSCQSEEATHELVADLRLGHHLRTHLLEHFVESCIIRSSSNRGIHAAIYSGNGRQHYEQVNALSEEFAIFGQR